MKHEWLIDILGDLRNYARKNGLAALSEELTTCQALAAVEISSMDEAPAWAEVGGSGAYRAPLGVKSGDERRLRIVPRPLATGNDA
ncbi:hypothetical protein EV655_10151 [Rhodovulum euryhalinum]|uniref:Uncharacterized protein n=1 Tax=Rhodovulum euryhalinum TaxID=35805 RepID=A0A4R2KSB3_9RHOB|nr:hypothetical protein EV655_10151 [Rhodovulum euryhalinum]